jgi:hypothetical protein
VPIRLKPPPEIVAEFTTTGAVPVDVSVTACVADELIVTSPRFNPVELTVNCGVGGDATVIPIPFRATWVVALTSVVIASPPTADPSVVGLNWISNVTD